LGLLNGSSPASKRQGQQSLSIKGRKRNVCERCCPIKWRGNKQDLAVEAGKLRILNAGILGTKVNRLKWKMRNKEYPLLEQRSGVRGQEPKITCRKELLRGGGAYGQKAVRQLNEKRPKGEEVNGWSHEHKKNL